MTSKIIKIVYNFAVHFLLMCHDCNPFVVSRTTGELISKLSMNLYDSHLAIIYICTNRERIMNVLNSRIN